MQLQQSNRFLTSFAAVLLLLFLVLYLRPYHGIRHDAVLYLGQALVRLYPAQLSGDLFFAYGSQAEFTIFPQVMAWLLGYFNAAQVFKFLTLLSLGLFVLASIFLLSRLLAKEQVFFALCSVLLMPGVYGGDRVFTYAEPFFTGRSIAEPLILMVFAAWFGGYRILAAGMWILAVLIHPLQAFTAALVLWIAMLWQDKRWWHMLWLLVPVFWMAYVGVDPFNKLFLRYDKDWLLWIMERTPQVFLTSWRLDDWGFWLTDVFLGWLILRDAQGRLKVFCRAAVAATCIALVLSLIFADGLNLVMPAGMQFWRTQWLLHWLVMSCVPLLLHREFVAERGFSPRWWLLLAIIVFGVSAGKIAPSPLAVLSMIPLYLAWPRLKQKVSEQFWRWLGILLPLVPLLGLSKYMLGVATLTADSQGVRDVFRPEFVLFSYPLVVGGVVAGGLWIWKYRPSSRVILCFLLIGMLTHAVMSWDRRNFWTRNIESSQYNEKIFGIELPATAQVFWDNELLAPWLILNRSSYYDRQQSAGLAFNRGTAAEAMRRKNTLATLRLQQQICSWVDGLNQEPGGCLISDEAIIDACRESQGSLDYLVLQERLARGSRGVWSLPVGTLGNQLVTYYLYACSDFISIHGSRGDEKHISLLALHGVS